MRLRPTNIPKTSINNPVKLMTKASWLRRSLRIKNFCDKPVSAVTIVIKKMATPKKTCHGAMLTLFVDSARGELLKLVDYDEDVEPKRLEQMVKIGLWCIQEEPLLRPSMKRVVLMLEGTVKIPVPPNPTSFLSVV
ncbi:hypothetical protein E3N88_37811 [Mikania micrantha]|uniref:Uncharacterized protein n=1 Tax=Mikania micrantha TaxID=192012 RepID=A0A5N6LS79_9ASTR|nr:hypothetical protein E3N88_37811 [Mikania micrantha]